MSDHQNPSSGRREILSQSQHTSQIPQFLTKRHTKNSKGTTKNQAIWESMPTLRQDYEAATRWILMIGHVFETRNLAFSNGSGLAGICQTIIQCQQKLRFLNIFMNPGLWRPLVEKWSELLWREQNRWPSVVNDYEWVTEFPMWTL